MSEAQATALSGYRLLIVEDEYTVAMELARDFEEAGAQIVGPAGSVQAALELLDESGSIDGAVLDIQLHEEKVFPVADELMRRGVPFVFASGFESWVIPPHYAAIPRCEKPVETAHLTRLLAETSKSVASIGAIQPP
jgi:DNA-binding LytR/AlgR family response regulator